MFTLRRTTTLLKSALLILGGLTSNATALDCVVTDSGDPPPGEPTAGTTLRSVPSQLRHLSTPHPRPGPARHFQFPQHDPPVPRGVDS